MRGGPALGVLRIVAGARGPEATAIDLDGRTRPDWARLVVEKRDALRGITRDEWERDLPEDFDWPALVAKAPGPETPRLLAIAGIRLRV